MISKFFKSETGTAVVLFALAIALLLGTVGLAVDGGLLYIEKQRIQNALDAACLAGAQELPDTAAARAKAIEYANLNGLDESEYEIRFTHDNRRLELSCNRVRNLFFMSVLGFDTAQVSTVAAAEGGLPGHAFDYTLFSGSTDDDLRLNGNELLVRGSAHTNADFRANGNHIEVTGACEAVGTVTTNGNNINIPYRYPNSDYVEMPDYEDEVREQAQSAGQVFHSSVHYNGNQINVEGSIYVDGNVHLNGNSISGTGAILATGDIHINGNCISATTQDQVCIYSLEDIHINGNNITIEGILYAPNGQIRFNGNNITINGKVIAYTVRFNGNDITINGDSCTVVSLPGEGCRLVY